MPRLKEVGQLPLEITGLGSCRAPKRFERRLADHAPGSFVKKLNKIEREMLLK